MNTPPPDAAAPSEEFLRRIADLQRLEVRLQLDGRRACVKWSIVTCGCRRWYDPREPGPPQRGCEVHGHVMVSPDGTEIL